MNPKILKSFYFMKLWQRWIYLLGVMGLLLTRVFALSEITCVVSAEYPPFEYYDDAGQMVGFDIDLAKEVAKKLKVPIRFEDKPFNTLLGCVQKGMADMAISSIGYTPERAKIVDFSDLYYHERLALFYAKSTPLKGLQDLRGKKVSCLTGSVTELWLKKSCPEAIILTFDSTPQTIEALKAGHVQACLLDESQGAVFTQKNSELMFVPVGTSGDGVGFIFPKNSALVAPVNKALAELKQEGVIDALKAKWINYVQDAVNEQNPSLASTPSQSSMDAFFQWFQQDFLSSSILVTLGLLVASLLMGFLLGLIIAIMRHRGIMEWFFNGFVSVVRGTPLILQLSLVYFVLPQVLGIRLSGLSAGILTFGLNSSAYMAEIFRGGIEALPRGQFEAARSLHIPTLPMWRDILFPQVLRIIRPSMVNEVVSLLKETALIAHLGTGNFPDIMRAAEIKSSQTFSHLLPLVTAGLQYYLLVMGVEYLANRWNNPEKNHD